MNLIRTELLTKRFASSTVVDKVSITVDQGDIYGFLGLNGAGKSTTIPMLLGMTNPTAGERFLFGKRVGEDLSVWNDVGYMVESASSYPRLTVLENLEVASFYRGKRDTKLILEIVDRLNLGTFRNRMAGELSLGNLQRLALAKALFHRPKLLILDEPINGLDPGGIVEVRNLLIDLASNGSTIFISSHILSEIARLATRVGIIHNGKMITEMSTDQLKGQLIRKLIVDTRNNVSALAALETEGIVGSINGAGSIELSDPSVISNPESISKLLVYAHLAPRQLYVYEENLEDYFLRLIETRDE
jgi:ABC-2 type transport system ATP-binding protein